MVSERPLRSAQSINIEVDRWKLGGLERVNIFTFLPNLSIDFLIVEISLSICFLSFSFFYVNHSSSDLVNAVEVAVEASSLDSGRYRKNINEF